MKNYGIYSNGSLLRVVTASSLKEAKAMVTQLYGSPSQRFGKFTVKLKNSGTDSWIPCKAVKVVKGKLLIKK